MSFINISIQVLQQNPPSVFRRWYIEWKKLQEVVFPFSKWRFQLKGRAPFINRMGIILHRDNNRPEKSTKDVL